MRTEIPVWKHEGKRPLGKTRHRLRDTEEELMCVRVGRLDLSVSG
jgi:hypothetical protein